MADHRPPSSSTAQRASLGPFEAVRELRYDAPFPALLPVHQRVDAPVEADPAGATRRALEPLRARIRPGMSVAVGAGSRGIRDVVPVVRAVGAWLREAGAQPFVVPAMGSHGGATAAGQLAVLAGLGMTEDTLAMPIRSGMDTVVLERLTDGRPPDGPDTHLDARAAAADGIIVVNRVKPHTDFRGPVESGLAKMLAIGLGKQRGASGIHAYGSRNLALWIPALAGRIVATGKVLGGVAIVENARDQTARVALVPAEEIGAAGEAALLEEARALMGRLPLPDIDVLVVDEMGKDKSGAGLDTNVIGRMMIRGSDEPPSPRIRNVVALDVSPASHGNAVGLGLTDFVPFRVIEQLDLRSMYINSMTAGIGGVQRGQIPIALPSDRDAVAAAILTCGRPDPEHVALVRIRDTLSTEDLLVSESLLPVVEADPGLTVTGPSVPMTFDESGCLDPVLAGIP